MSKISSTKAYARFLSDIKERIRSAQYDALRAVNRELITLYWDIGRMIIIRQNKEGWGKAVVESLAMDLRREFPSLTGFSAQNLWRMKQFYEAYAPYPKLSTLLRELGWSGHLHILSKSKTIKEREFYLRLAVNEKYSVRELERQIDSGSFERVMLSKEKVSPLVTQLRHKAPDVFKDSYVLDFLDLPENHTEKDLQQAIIANLKNFILEFGRDFSFVGQEFRIQVGKNDYYIDLLFFHRGLCCLVMFELKIDDFKPEYLGKLNFYLEALDRDVRKMHENPSVGIILCKSKDDEVVEYALSRNLSPALVAEYRTQLIPKKVLEKKLHEFFALTR